MQDEAVFILKLELFGHCIGLELEESLLHSQVLPLVYGLEDLVHGCFKLDEDKLVLSHHVEGLHMEQVLPIE